MCVAFSIYEIIHTKKRVDPAELNSKILSKNEKLGKAN